MNMAMRGKAWIPTFWSRDVPEQSLQPKSPAKVVANIDNSNEMPEEDNWSDATSEDSIDFEVKSKLLLQSTASAPFCQRSELTIAVPSLFGQDLPPCGPIQQVAYANVNKRLRKLWLQHINDQSDDNPILSICIRVRNDLEAEANEFPSGNQLGTKKRKPWRRKIVFEYEYRWSKYFLREAEMQQMIHETNKAQLEEQVFLDGVYPIPKELHMVVKDRLNKIMVQEAWKTWNAKKRGGAIADIEEGLRTLGFPSASANEHIEDVAVKTSEQDIKSCQLKGSS